MLSTEFLKNAKLNDVLHFWARKMKKKLKLKKVFHRKIVPKKIFFKFFHFPETQKIKKMKIARSGNLEKSEFQTELFSKYRKE